MTTLTWLAERSEASLRSALGAVAPRLGNQSLAMSPSDVRATDPRWFSGSAVLDHRLVVKFAWSEQAAAALHREGRILELLRAHAPDLPIPDVVVASEDPVLVVTRLVPGRPLTSGDARRFNKAETARVADELGVFLARLHAPDILRVAQDRGVPLALPEPQADTESLRTRFLPLVEPRQRATVLAWCDWIDDVLAEPAGELSLVHGDLHGFNQVWEWGTRTLRAVVDFEESGPADPLYDFRYLPGQGPVALLHAIARRYETETGRTVNLARVMAWHVRTALGDAWWRTEANVALPGGGTAVSWVDELAGRMQTLDSELRLPPWRPAADWKRVGHPYCRGAPPMTSAVAHPRELAELDLFQVWTEAAPLAERYDPFRFDQRMAAYRQLIDTINHDGLFGEDNRHNPLWGLMFQHQWQFDTGRLGPSSRQDGRIDPDAPWGYGNYALSVIPWLGASSAGMVPNLALAGPPTPSRFDYASGRTPDLRLPQEFEDGVEDWRRFFALVRETHPGTDQEPIRLALWKAHKTCLDVVARRIAGIDPAPYSVRELTFLQGWCRMVDYLWVAAWPTDFDFMVENGLGVLPDRLLDPDDDLHDMPEKVQRNVGNVMELARTRAWRYGLNLWLWKRVMRTRKAREEVVPMLEAVFHPNPANVTDRRRLIWYLLRP